MAVEILENATSRSRWQALTDAAQAPLQQCWGYGDAARSLGGGILRMELREGGKTIALAQGIRRRWLVPVTLITRGPVWIGTPDPDRRSRAISTLRLGLNGTVVLTPDTGLPDDALRQAGLKCVMTPATVAMLPLSAGLRDRMTGKWRNRLARAERAGLNVRVSHPTAEKLRWLLQHDAAQQKARRYRALPAAFTTAWLGQSPNSGFMVEALKSGETLAAMLFLRHGTSATYHIGWTSDRGRAVSAHNLTLWHAAAHLADTGAAVLDLGLVDTETAPGLARFKLGTGARSLSTGGTWICLRR